MNIFGDLERFASDLYPYRWPITLGALLALAALLVFAYRMGWHRVIGRHRLAAAIITIPLLAVAVPAGYYTLSPLWQRTALDEANPLAASATEARPSVGAPAAAPPPAGPSAASFAARVTHSGQFEGADDFHFGRGRAQLIETGPGRYTLRLEDFSVRNGPDLFVYLSPSASGYAEGAINLGRLKATDGAFNYDIPPGTDVSQVKSVVVWCRRFSVLFATAPLAQA